MDIPLTARVRFLQCCCMAIHYFTYDTAIGDLTLFSRDGKIIFIHFGERAIASGTREEDETLLLAIKEINQFFFGQRKDFDVPLDPLGDEDEKKILACLEDVAYGTLTTYEAIAKKSGFPLEKVVEAIDGTTVPLRPHSICLHGDSPKAVEMARTLRARLEEAGIQIVPLRAMSL